MPLTLFFLIFAKASTNKKYNLNILLVSYKDKSRSNLNCLNSLF